jgi:hypothetical protein
MGLSPPTMRSVEGTEEEAGHGAEPADDAGRYAVQRKTLDSVIRR